ncbi:hypothetical protein HTZ84_21060 [Haloterrigena sp. SYSU A558-1]|uniref:Uncharacterized protein n=1 Tax=Haloterrigena gelatinilytica TaxID=2741724 RepID=A0ABX2LES7_9EURY|nr:hypothetical protein [Haloterrigena gelatinilytica]NUC74755.1 hypothetical protein [Haloterrigena gelatinilytica]
MNGNSTESHETPDGYVTTQIDVVDGVVELTRHGPRENMFKQITTNVDCLTDSYQYFGTDECIKAKLWEGDDGKKRLYARFRRTDNRNKFWEHYAELTDIAENAGEGDA